MCVVTSALQGQSLLTTGTSKLRHAQQASARRSSGGKLTLDEATVAAIEAGLDDAQPLEIAVSEARSRLVIRNHVSRRISRLRTRAREEAAKRA